MPISKDGARALKSAALELQEASEHLRHAGDTSPGVAEVAAANYIEKDDAFQDALGTVRKENDEGEETPVEEEPAAHEPTDEDDHDGVTGSKSKGENDEGAKSGKDGEGNPATDTKDEKGKTKDGK